MRYTKKHEEITLVEFQNVLRKVRDKFLREMKREGFYLSDFAMGPTKPLPWDINNGLCDDFCREVFKRLGGETEMNVGLWHENMPDYDENKDQMCHCFIRWKGRFYDAECIEGADQWRDLPANRPKNPRPYHRKKSC